MHGTNMKIAILNYRNLNPTHVTTETSDRSESAHREGWKFADPTFHVQFVLQSTIECLNITTHVQVPFFLLCYYNERAGIAQSVLRLATGWTVRGSNPDGARFSASVQTGPGAHPSQWVPGLLTFSGRGVALATHPHLAPMLKKE